MHKVLLKVGMVCLLVLFASQSLAGRVNVKKLHSATWIHLETQNFSVFTDANEKQAREMAEELEHFHYFLSFLLGFDQEPLSERVPVILAKNRATFAALGFPKYIGGIFVENNGYVIFANADGFKSPAQGKGSTGRTIILHELAHLIINNSSHNLSTAYWYQEGIAEYFGTYMEKDGHVIL